MTPDLEKWGPRWQAEYNFLKEHYKKKENICTYDELPDRMEELATVLSLMGGQGE